MENKKSTLVWHFVFGIAIFVLIVLILLNLELVTGCLFNCVRYRNKILICSSALVLVIAVYVFYIKRVVSSVPKHRLASSRLKKASYNDAESPNTLKEGDSD